MCVSVTLLCLKSLCSLLWDPVMTSGLQFPGLPAMPVRPCSIPSTDGLVSGPAGGALCGHVPCQAWHVGDHTEHHQPLPLEKQTRVSWDWDQREGTFSLMCCFLVVLADFRLDAFLQLIWESENQLGPTLQAVD